MATASALHEFISRSAEIVDRWNPDDRMWFRGHSNANWPLRPNIYRSNNGLKQREDALRREFSYRSLPYFEGSMLRPHDDWDWYFVMQHYGLPTRLLDWSENPLVALYFALRNHKGPATHAAVWVLDPWWLNQVFDEKKRRVIFDPEREEAKRYLHAPYADSSVMPSHPIALRPRYTTRRIAAQRGVFTLHGRDEKPLDEYEELRPRLEKVEIPTAHVPGMRRSLANADVTEAVVFPELPGICREVLDFWSRGLFEY
jgi:hypothetical protein